MIWISERSNCMLLFLEMRIEFRVWRWNNHKGRTRAKNRFSKLIKKKKKKRKKKVRSSINAKIFGSFAYSLFFFSFFPFPSFSFLLLRFSSPSSSLLRLFASFPGEESYFWNDLDWKMLNSAQRKRKTEKTETKKEKQKSNLWIETWCFFLLLTLRDMLLHHMRQKETCLSKHHLAKKSLLTWYSKIFFFPSKFLPISRTKWKNFLTFQKRNWEGIPFWVDVIGDERLK